MELVTHVQVLYEVVCISFGANTPGKGMNPSVLSYQWVTSLGERKLNSNQLNVHVLFHF